MTKNTNSKKNKQKANKNCKQVILLNINDHKSPVSRQRLTEWIKNEVHLPTIYKKLSFKDGCSLEVTR